MFISDTIKSEVITVTPRLAKQLLEQNTGNRTISKTNLARVKTAMERNEWVLNGEAIKIAKDGRILDGQHRLHASFETDTTFDTLIVYGLDDDTQESMDAGKARTASDALAIRGYKSTHSLAAITTAIIKAEQWNIKAAVTTASSFYAVTTKQVVDRVEREPAITDLVRTAVKFPKVGLSGKTAGLLYYLFSKIDAEDTEDFFHKLLSGENLDRGHPALTLRNLLLRLKDERGLKDQSYIAALTIKAWNRYRAGQDVLSLRYAPGGAKPEPFPEPQ
ncbi:MAG: hypothetical protein L0L76_10445 [Yaniella sp.]|uniref:hypothetical protein n=1 Tax=Yaniella sp. TaxID=2773929 RepID=UPI002647DD87|nr:hypothetical protein [Yaniella sp.]MDN6358432.1 hypothetical protein [Yaniella sp.]MDN6759008.1 hypothetical protein [Yaniella sp.]